MWLCCALIIRSAVYFFSHLLRIRPIRLRCNERHVSRQSIQTKKRKVFAVRISEHEGKADTSTRRLPMYITLITLIATLACWRLLAMRKPGNSDGVNYRLARDNRTVIDCCYRDIRADIWTSLEKNRARTHARNPSVRQS